LQNDVIGTRIPRLDAKLQVTGKAVYGEDLYRPNMLFAVALRSKYAHALIKKIDISKAQDAEGVEAIITGKDIPNNVFGFTHVDQPVLADEKVRYYGEPIAVVAAKTLEQAKDALDLIKVEYDVLPAIFDAKQALQKNAPKIHEKGNLASHVKIRFGDYQKAIEEAEVVVEDTFSSQYIEHVHLEPHVALAEIENDGKLVIWTSTSRPFSYLTHLCKILEIPSHKLKVKVPSVGGSFGGKNEISLEPWVAVLALKTKKPVKMVFTREEEFSGSSVRHPYTIHYTSGLTRDGKLTARKIEVYSNSGPYVQLGEETLKRACINGCGPYYIPNVMVDGYLVYTNGLVGGAMRGFGVSQVAFAHEVHTEKICRQLGIDSFEFRIMNALQVNDVLPTGQLLLDATLKETLIKAREKVFAGKEG
jgi:CO/xanthine dehydrogenase Mo-binding subunit